MRKFGLGRDALGRRVAVWGDKEPNIQIVGVVGNAKYQGVKDRLRAGIYTAHQQDAKLGTVTYYVRTAGDPAQRAASDSRGRCRGSTRTSPCRS